MLRPALLAAVAAGAVAAASRPAGAENAGLLPPAIGTTELYVSDPLSGLALRGFDPVSYLVGAQPRPGLQRFEIVWAGLAWRFASAANLEAFRRDPEAFAPRIGGYDAETAAAGRLTAGDPFVFAVRDGRVYLFRTGKARGRFAADPGAPARAESAWARLRAALVRG